MPAPASPLLDSLFLYKLEQLKLVSRKIFTGTIKGEWRTKRKGQSVEFAVYRPSPSRLEPPAKCLTTIRIPRRPGCLRD